MTSKVWVELSDHNGVVTDDYMKAIGRAFQRLGCNVSYEYDIANCRGGKQDIYVVSLALTAFKLLISGRPNVVFWSQGVWPEESLQKHGSRLRFAACNFVENLALKKARLLFLVSHAQLAHYESKYNIHLSDKAFTMPCSNEVFHEDSFLYPRKYDAPVFVYAGSLAKYQCIGEMLNAFKQVQSVCPLAQLLFYTAQQDEARALIDEARVDNVVIGHAEPDELDGILAKAKYGFVIRDNSIVNRVATPTKISSYISNGVIPVYSPTLQAFSESSANIERLEYREETFADDFSEFEMKKLDPNQLLSSYKAYFLSQFDYEAQADSIATFVGKILVEAR